MTGSQDASHGELHYVGSVFLDYSQSKAGWRVMQIVSASGGVKSLTDPLGYLTSGSLAAWFAGTEYALSD
jgi:hypothetical protein